MYWLWPLRDILPGRRHFNVPGKRQDTAAATNGAFVPLAKALEQSNRIMAQVLLAEAGFMEPQGKNAQNFLRSLLVNPSADFSVDVVRELTASFKTGQP